jgi:hypothetical protein
MSAENRKPPRDAIPGLRVSGQLCSVFFFFARRLFLFVARSREREACFCLHRGISRGSVPNARLTDVSPSISLCFSLSLPLLSLSAGGITLQRRRRWWMAMVGLVVGGQRLKVEEPAANGMPHLEDRKPAGLRVSVEREPLSHSSFPSLCVLLCARVCLKCVWAAEQV